MKPWPTPAETIICGPEVVPGKELGPVVSFFCYWVTWMPHSLLRKVVKLELKVQGLPMGGCSGARYEFP